MKLLLKLFLLVCLPFLSGAQISPLLIEPTKKQADSLRIVLEQTTNDTLRMAALRDLAIYYIDANIDSAIYFIEQELPLTKQLQLKLWEADALDLYAVFLNSKGNYPQALKMMNEALAIAADNESEKNIWRISRFTTNQNATSARLNMLALIEFDLGGVYQETENFEQQLLHYQKAIKTASPLNNYALLSIVNNYYLELQPLPLKCFFSTGIFFQFSISKKPFLNLL